MIKMTWLIDCSTNLRGQLESCTCEKKTIKKNKSKGH